MAVGPWRARRKPESKSQRPFILFYLFLPYLALPTIKVPAPARALSKVISSVQNGGNVQDLFFFLSFSCAEPLTHYVALGILFGVTVSSQRHSAVGMGM
jgi:hypothetical protein